MITDMNARVAMAQKLSIPQLQQAIKNGTVPAYVGVPLLQDKMRQQQQMAMAQQGQQAQQQPPIAEQIMAEASNSGVDQLPSNLPVADEEEDYAQGGIVAFAGNSGSLVPKTPQYSNEPKDTEENQAPAPTPLFDLPAWFRNRLQAAEQRAAGERVELAYPKDQRIESPAESETALANTQAGISQREPETIGPQGLRGIPLTPAKAASDTGAGRATTAGATTTTPKAAATAAEAAPAPMSALDKYAEMLMKEREGIAKDRQQAKAMAILQTGLGIAGGTSPNPLANISQGALQGTQAYQQEMKGIRREDADRLKQLMALGISKEKIANEARKLGITEKHYEQMFELGRSRIGAGNAERANAVFAGQVNGIFSKLLAAKAREMGTTIDGISEDVYEQLHNTAYNLASKSAGRSVPETTAAPKSDFSGFSLVPKK